MTTGGLGRRTPNDFEHVEKYPLSALAPTVPQTVNRTLALPSWHWTHDQGDEGACEGFGNSMMMSILNTAQSGTTKRYNPWWLWNKAKLIDEWSDTNPGDDNGTSGRASCEVLRTDGHLPTKPVSAQPEYTSGIERVKGSPSDGIAAYRWATTVDEMRSAIAMNKPIAIGVNWYGGFDTPSVRNGEQYIFIGNSKIRGGHCVCVYGASDTRQAFRVKNSWGKSYPLVWLPYTTMERLLKEAGESCIITDR